MRVIALERGHCGTTTREANEEFDVADERIGKNGKPVDGSTWFVPVDQAPESKPVEKNARPPGAGPKAGSKLAAEPVA